MSIPELLVVLIILLVSIVVLVAVLWNFWYTTGKPWELGLGKISLISCHILAILGFISAFILNTHALIATFKYSLLLIFYVLPILSVIAIVLALRRAYIKASIFSLGSTGLFLLLFSVFFQEKRFLDSMGKSLLSFGTVIMIIAYFAVAIPSINFIRVKFVESLRSKSAKS